MGMAEGGRSRGREMGAEQRMEPIEGRSGRAVQIRRTVPHVRGECGPEHRREAEPSDWSWSELTSSSTLTSSPATPTPRATAARRRDGREGIIVAEQRLGRQRETTRVLAKNSSEKPVSENRSEATAKR